MTFQTRQPLTALNLSAATGLNRGDIVRLNYVGAQSASRSALQRLASSDSSYFSPIYRCTFFTSFNDDGIFFLLFDSTLTVAAFFIASFAESNSAMLMSLRLKNFFTCSYRFGHSSPISI
jgi:hypothetical protein